MTVNFSQSAVVAAPGQQYTLSSLVTIAPGGLPQYLVLTGFDFDRYTATSQHSVGVLTGDGKTVAMGNTSLLFTYTDQGYYSSDLGYLSALNYVASTDNNRSDYLSVYGYGSAGTPDASQFAVLSGLSSAMQLLYTGSRFLGSLNVVTRSNYTDATPNAATPDEIAAVTASFVGKIWSDQGCWVLVSNIAAAAGATLPVSSAVTNDTMSPVGNGEWIVAYDSTKASAAQQQTWQMLLRPGDIVDIAGWCTNHVATVVAGKGYGAMTIDNRGVSANDGASGDIIIDGPLNVMESLNGGFAKYVTIYRMDTPVITPLAALALPTGATKSIAGLFSTADSGGKAIVSYQFYDSGTASGSFSVNGVAHITHSIDNALTVSADDLARTQFTAGSAAGGDSIMVRAYNGSYWGDWEAIDVLIGTTIQAPAVSVAPGTVLVRAGEQASLVSLVSASSPDTPITTYTIHDPADGGHIELNGAVNLRGGVAQATDHYVSYMSPDLSIARYSDMTYEVSTQDFAKLGYVAGGVMSRADALTITASNGSQQSSLPVDLSVLSVGMEAVGISHYLAPGTTIPASTLFALSGTDGNHPLHSYAISLINPGTNSGTINLNGAVNGVSSSLVNAAGLYEVSPSDFTKLTYTVGLDANLLGQTIGITALDTVSFANTQLVIYNATAPSQVSAKAGQVSTGTTVALTSLFDTQQASSALLFHIFDPQGGGTVNINDATNELGKRAQLGEYFVTGSNVSKMSYTGGTGNDTLLIATSNDLGKTWAAEIPVHVGGSPTPAAAPLTVMGFSPATGGAIAVDGNIMITFSEAIKLGDGVITLENSAGQVVETYHPGSTKLTISGNVLTINPSADLTFGTDYLVKFAAGTIKDLGDSSYVGTTSYNFTTVAAPDAAPSVTTFSPSDGSMGATVGGNIVVTFSEAIQRGIGNIVLKTAAGATVATYDAANSANMTVSGNTLTLNPSANLGIFTSYKVEIGSAAVKDLAGNNYAGVSDYSFTTQTPDSLYHFCLVAFSAAPGEAYMNQLALAYNAGMTIQDIVRVFCTKPQFTSTYAESMTNTELATLLVANVVKNSATDATKNAAINDIVIALDAGMTRGDMIYQVFGNLATKPLNDPDWGNTALQFNNQTEVAKHFTEVMHNSTTDMPTLKAVIGSVTPSTDVSTPEHIATLIGVELAVMH